MTSGLTDDETLPRCKDDVGCDLLKAVDGENPLDLGYGDDSVQNEPFDPYRVEAVCFRV